MEKVEGLYKTEVFGVTLAASLPFYFFVLFRRENPAHYMSSLAKRMRPDKFDDMDSALEKILGENNLDGKEVFVALTSRGIRDVGSFLVRGEEAL